MKLIRRSSLKCQSWQSVRLMVQHLKKAVQNAELVIQEWIETAKELGRPIPEPKGRLMFA